MRIKLKALFGISNPETMELSDVAKEISLMTYTDPAIVKAAVSEQKEAIRIAKDVRSISRRRFISIAFATGCGIAGLQGKINIDSMAESMRENAQQRAEKLKQQIKDPDSIQPELEKEKSTDNSRGTLIFMSKTIGLFALAGASSLVSSFYSSRREMHRSDIKQLADLNTQERVITSFKSLSPHSLK